MTVVRVRRPRGATLARTDGAVVCAIALGGFVLAEALGLVATVAAQHLAGFPGSWRALASLATPPWWYSTASLVGIWVGFLGAVGLGQSVFRLIDPIGLRVRLLDPLFVVLGVGLQFLVTALYWPWRGHDFSGPSHQIFGTSTGTSFALLCVLTVVGAPIVEELFFRGLLLSGLRGVFSRSRTGVAVVVPVALDGVLFGLAHGEPSELAGLALVGVVLAGVYVATRRLVPCIITHASFNLVAVIAIIADRAHS